MSTNRAFDRALYRPEAEVRLEILAIELRDEITGGRLEASRAAHIGTTDLSVVLTRGGGTDPTTLRDSEQLALIHADARSLMRVQAVQLQLQLDKALRRGASMDAATRAHLQDSADTLSQLIPARAFATRSYSSVASTGAPPIARAASKAGYRPASRSSCASR